MRLAGHDVPFRIDAEAVQVKELARLAAGASDMTDLLERLAIQDRDALVGAEETRLRGEPGDRVGDLLRVEVEIVDAGLLQGDGQFDADGSGPDDADVSVFAVPVANGFDLKA